MRTAKDFLAEHTTDLWGDEYPDTQLRLEPDDIIARDIEVLVAAVKLVSGVTIAVLHDGELLSRDPLNVRGEAMKRIYDLIAELRKGLKDA